MSKETEESVRRGLDQAARGELVGFDESRLDEENTGTPPDVTKPPESDTIPTKSETISPPNVTKPTLPETLPNKEPEETIEKEVEEIFDAVASDRYKLQNTEQTIEERKSAMKSLRLAGVPDDFGPAHRDWSNPGKTSWRHKWMRANGSV